MKETFLHWVWQQQLLNSTTLCTTEKENINIFRAGRLNTLQGPDFYEALIEINGQKWAGTVEVHVKSSDWYAHQHQQDENYNNVILHVVYEHDVDVYDKHNNTLATLELKGYIDPKVLLNYNELMRNQNQWIFCEKKINEIDAFIIQNWLERVYVERLERKVAEIEILYEKSNKDWEATLFLMMSKYFGGNLNGILFIEAFLQVDFSIIRKQMVNQNLTALLFGLAGLLEKNDYEDPYYLQLQQEFLYLKQKYQLESLVVPIVHFYGCRPPNFPTIRLAQLIGLYQKEHTLFAKLISLGTSLKKDQDLFSVSVDLYWQEHYNFGKTSKKSPKKISKRFMDLLLMNVVVPVLFFYAKTKGKDTANLLDLMYGLAPEHNKVIEKFKAVGFSISSALETQALLTLKKEYCEKERCPECAIGAAYFKKG
ncbi:DUF2851 family protein [Ochrovirga pacifica]|uniref:DUF2851 family protein n=1 Tax=Ochrovirga pacifica TaxID=1042376 RepID=UPI0002558391|nr:DUF2851 family protein [Ochrovirga pacifica]